MNFVVGPSLVVPPLCSFYGRPCARSCKARESALIHALLNLNDVLGYTIRDVRYMDGA
jgi:hypothetical protein